MLRQSSSRNHRSKGLKLKKALQISLLVLVSVWLLYQLKHSYEKKKAYAEHESNELHKDDQGQVEIIRLGRKDLPPKMEADSSTLDERIEDEENEEMEQEMKHDDNDDDPIDEPDLDKDDDLPELGEQSSDKDGGVDDVGVFDDEERKERSQEDQEKSFHGDNVSSAVAHDPPTEREDLTHQAQEKILYVDDASSAVPHENQESERKEEEAREAREKSFKGDDVSSAVDHDAQVTKPLPEEQMKSMDRIFEGTTNLSNGLSFQDPGMNGSNTAGEHWATPTNVSSHLNVSINNAVSESKTDPAAVNLTNSHIGTGQANSTSLNGQLEQQANSTAVLNNPIQLFSNLTASDLSELKSPPHGTSALVSTDAQKTVSGDDDNNTGTSLTPVNNKVEDGDTQRVADASVKIMNKAMSEDEVLLE